MTAGIGHLVVGPGEHGVVRHARSIADAMAARFVAASPKPAPTGVVAGGDGHDPVVVVDGIDDLGAPDLDRLAACSAVHVAFTDRLFGGSCEAAAAGFADLADRLARDGAIVVVGLHDLPDPAFGALQRRRAGAYRAVVEAAGAVVVGSHHEAALTRGLGAPPRSIAVIPLPVAPMRRGGASGSPVVRAVVDQPTILGFIYPGKGHDDVLDAIDGLAGHIGVVALGRPSDGHEALAADLLASAAARGRRFEVTGFVPDDDLPAALGAAGVPIAPHARVSASASIAAWLGAGRRPLVPDVPYVQELERRAPGSMQIYRGVRDLREQIRLALAEPSRTWLASEATTGPTLPEVARRYRDALRLVALHGPHVPVTALAVATGDPVALAVGASDARALRSTG